jgi:hypothetical protein
MGATSSLAGFSDWPHLRPVRLILEPPLGRNLSLLRPQEGAYVPNNCIAFLVRSKPKMLRTRLKLYANTFRLISVATFWMPRVRKCVHPSSA